ncbi:hypothetical protein ACQ4PT_011235 [Festuca glaucescens]
MFPEEKIALGFMAAFVIGAIIMALCSGREREDRGGGADAGPAAWVAAAAPPPPAAAEVVELGCFLYSTEGRLASEKLVCVICLEMLEHGEKCSEVPACRHLFHRDCIDTWMKSSATCPMCRRVMVTGLSAGDDMV